MPAATGEPAVAVDPIEARLAEVERLHRAGVAAIEDYRPEEAAGPLTEAEALLDALPGVDEDVEGVPELRTRVVLARSWVAFEREGSAGADPLLDRATASARALGRDDLVALCLMQAASMRGRSGDLVGSLQLMREAETGLGLLPVTDQARLVINRGVIAAQLMDLEPARADLARGAALARAADATSMEFIARHNQGYVEFLRGDLPAALALMDAADDMDVQVSRTVSQLDQARVLLEAGLLDEAAECLHRARALAEQEGGEQDLGEIELDLARTLLLLGDADGSAALAAVARRRFARRGASPWSRQARLVELEADSAARRHPARTARLAEGLASAAERRGEGHLARRAALIAADALLDVGDATGARAAYGRAVPLLRSASLPTRLHLRLVAARLDLLDEAGSARRVARTLATAADDLALAQVRASSLDLRTALAVHSNRLALLDLGLGVESGSVAALFARTERWRAVSVRVPFVRPPRDPRAAQLLSRLRRLRDDLRSAPPEEQSVMRTEAAALERRLRGLDWAGRADPAEHPRPEHPIGYSAALAAVRAAGAEALTFLPHGTDLYAVHLAARGGRIVRLGPLERILALVHRVRADAEASSLPALGAMRSAVEGSLAAGLAELDALLLGLLGTPDRLVVVPSRALSALPWGMLPSRLGRATTVARTITAWAAAADERAISVPRVLAIAGPDLVHADREAAEVARVWGGVLVPSARARLGEVVGALADRDLIHIAAHGRHHHQNPLFSTLRLVDGSAFAYDLPAVGVGASHVVLSACEVGRATIRAGDESLGLTAVLFSLGVRTVVAAVSRIPDDVAAVAMTAYHRRLAAGVDSAQALADATVDLPPIARAFVCVGADWRCDPVPG